MATLVQAEPVATAEGAVAADRESASSDIRTVGAGALLQNLQQVWRSELGARFAGGAAWTTTSGILSQGLGLLTSVILARYLGKLAFGGLALLQTTAAVCILLAYFGLAPTLTKHIAELRANAPIAAGRLISLAVIATGAGSTAVAVVLVVVRHWLAIRVLASADLSAYLLICALLVPLEGLNSVLAGALLGLDGFAALARIRAVTAFLTLLFMAAGAYYAGIGGALGGLVAAALVRVWLSAMAFGTARRRWHIPVAMPSSVSDATLLWTFGLPMLIAQLTVLPVNWICMAMLVNQANGYAALGIFTAANQWYLAAMLIPGLLEQVVLPFLSEGLQSGEASAAAVLRLAMKTNALVVMPVVIVGSLTSPLIMRIYGPEFAPHWKVLVLALLTAALACLHIPAGQVLVASGRAWTACWMNLAWALSFIGFMSVTARWGAIGFAGARLLAYVAHCIWTFVFVYRVLASAASATARTAHA